MFTECGFLGYSFIPKPPFEFARGFKKKKGPVHNPTKPEYTTKEFPVV